MQAFKENDLKEVKVRDIALPTLQLLGNERDAFLAGAYTAYPLGDVLFNLKRSPLVDAVTQETFRQAFFAFHNLFTRPGTFEFYLEVFRAVFGLDVEVEFTTPAPGKLLINVHSLSVTTFDFLARRIVDNAYVYDNVVDEDDNQLVFQGTTGLKTQAEMDALMFELYPAGIWVEATLEID